MRVIVKRIARQHGGDMTEGRPGVVRRGARYLGVEAPRLAAVPAIQADGLRAGLGAAHHSSAPDMGVVVWWNGSRLGTG